MKFNLHILRTKIIYSRNFPTFLDQIDISTQGSSKSTKNMFKHISIVFYESTEIIVGL